MKPWWMRLAVFARPQCRGLLTIGLMIFITAGLTALKPWPMKLLVDYVFSQRPLPVGMSWLAAFPGGSSAAGLCVWMAAGTMLIFATAWGVQTVQAYIESGVALRITYGLGSRVFEHLQRLSLRFHSRHPAGDLVRRVTRDSRCARDIILDVIVPATTSITTLVAMFWVMWHMDVWMSLVALSVIPVLMGAGRRFYQPMMERSLEQQQCEGRLMSHAEETLTALPAVQAFGRESDEESKYRGITADTLRAYFRCLASKLQFKIWVGGSSSAGRAAVMLFGGYRVLSGAITIGDLLVFLAYVDMLYTPLNTLAHLAATVARAEANARRVFEVLDTVAPDLPREGLVAMPSSGWKGHVQFEHVSFGYRPDSYVLNRVDIDIRAGEVVAIVGHTGAGKSTLMSLLLRFFDPCHGRILLDGIDLRDIPLSMLRSQIAILLQDPFLLPVSVAENIAYGRPDASRDEIEAAAVAANADQFIRSLPSGYKTVIHERAASLSGGQRQRVAIARALLKDAPILILDEPTSALDAQTESQLMEALHRLINGRTTFIIAHRLSTVRDAHRIIVLRDGMVVESGTHRDLLAARGVYYALHERYREGQHREIRA